ncbi:MAG: hypothetical protein QG661_1574 [Actinomycetota bacterium]|nr:hypothetical protein [Actinomycetota bacterium]
MTTLAEPEARALEGFCRRQLRWDSRMPARVVTTPTALGVFTAPPLGVLAFAAVPVTDVEEPTDILVQLAGLADALREPPLDLGALTRAIVPPGPAPSLSHLPPAEGWQIPMHAVSGDLVPVVEAASREFATRSSGRTPSEQEEIAEEIWRRPSFGGLPLRSLHAARQLGMLTGDMARVSVATCGQWKRLSTVRGQVFSYATGPAARLALRVVR